MKQEGALGLIDSAAEAVARLPGWVGLLWLTALPARLVLAWVCVRLIELGAEAVHFGDWLRRAAAALGVAWLVSLWGRQVFVRACRHALQSERPAPRSLLRVPAREMAGHACGALAVEVAFWALLATFVAPPFLLVAAGLSAAASPAGGPAPLDALRELWRGVGPAGRLIRLLFLFGIGLVLAAVNLHFAARGALWLSQGIASLDTTGWDAVLQPGNPAYAVLLLAGASLLLEPVWLAALTAHVEQVRSRSNGEDLRRWFAELRAGA